MFYQVRILLLFLLGTSVCYGMEKCSTPANQLPEPFCFIKAGDCEQLAQCMRLVPTYRDAILQQDTDDIPHTPLTYVFQQFGADLDRSDLLCDLVHILLHAGVDPNKGFERKPIHYAAGCGLLEPLELLYAFKADIKAVDAHGATAIHYAAGCDVSLLRFAFWPPKKASSVVLLRTNSPSDLLDRPSFGKSEILARRAAARMSDATGAEGTVRPAIVTKLLAWGVDGDACDTKEKTAWDYASRLGLKLVMECLVKKPKSK